MLWHRLQLRLRFGCWFVLWFGVLLRSMGAAWVSDAMARKWRLLWRMRSVLCSLLWSFLGVWLQLRLQLVEKIGCWRWLRGHSVTGGQYSEFTYPYKLSTPTNTSLISILLIAQDYAHHDVHARSICPIRQYSSPYSRSVCKIWWHSSWDSRSVCPIRRHSSRHSIISFLTRTRRARFSKQLVVVAEKLPMELFLTVQWVLEIVCRRGSQLVGGNSC
jgi:hypothetical protein